MRRSPILVGALCGPPAQRSARHTPNAAHVARAGEPGLITRHPRRHRKAVVRNYGFQPTEKSFDLAGCPLVTPAEL